MHGIPVGRIAGYLVENPCKLAFGHNRLRQQLGLVEMTRKRIGEGLLTEYSEICPDCEGRGVVVDYSLLE